MWCLLTACLSPYCLCQLMLCAVLAKALAPWVCGLRADDLLSHLRLMYDLRNPNLSCIQV